MQQRITERSAERSPLAHNCKDCSYWLDNVPEPMPLPSHVLEDADVVVIGSGYTGLHAAIQTARGGRTTLVLDAQDAGWGCSTRNGGQISTSVKPSLAKLSARLGVGRARAIRQEGETALKWIEEFVNAEAIACDFRRCGRFHAAHTPRHYDELARDAEELCRIDGIEAHPVSRSEQRRELGTDAYFGGVVFARHASLDPAKYHRGLLELASREGVHITPHCAVTHIKQTARGFELGTEKGTIRARDVVVATNGYTSGLTPWLQRRVIPIGSYVIATEPLPKDLVAALFPTNRVASDTCKVVYYYRASPDGTRVLFGGRVSAGETDTTISGPKLYAEMCRIFPELFDYQVTHSWMGSVAYTFDQLAHTGIHDGVYYAMGYCGSGVSMASYLGMRLGQKVLGLKEGQTGFDGIANPTRPFYRGNPWFLPAAVALYRWRDRFQHRRAQALQ